MLNPYVPFPLIIPQLLQPRVTLSERVLLVSWFCGISLEVTWNMRLPPVANNFSLTKYPIFQTPLPRLVINRFQPKFVWWVSIIQSSYIILVISFEDSVIDLYHSKVLDFKCHFGFIKRFLKSKNLHTCILVY